MSMIPWVPNLQVSFRDTPDLLNLQVLDRDTPDLQKPHNSRLWLHHMTCTRS